MVSVIVLCECFSSFGPLPSYELKDSAHIHREAAAGDQTHAACHRATGGRAVRHKYPVCFAYFDVGECPRFFFPKAPGLAQAIELAISRQLLLDASPKADGSDEIEYRCRG